MGVRRAPWPGLLAALAALGVAALLVLPRLHSAPAPARTSAAAEPPPAPPDPWSPPAHLPRPAMRYERFETFTRADGLPSNRVTTVLVEKGRICAGTDAGLAIGKPGAFHVYTTANGLAHDYVTSVSRDERTGSLWISTLGGLSRLSGNTLRTYTARNSGLVNNVVYHVVARDGLVWAATAAGTSCFDVRAGTWALYNQTNSIMHEPWCYALALGPARLFVGVWGGGVVELDRTTGRWREHRDPDGEMELDLLRDDGPIHDVTSFVAYDAGVLWQATYFGLSRYDGRHWRSYLTEDTGLPGDFLNHVAARGHTAWLSSDQGFGVFDGTTCVAYHRLPDGRCRVRVTRAGKLAETGTLATAPGHDYVLWAQGGDHDVWLATAAGLSHGFARAAGGDARGSDAERSDR
jgi:ligand-binding sensor domain-containing protein